MVFSDISFPYHLSKYFLFENVSFTWKINEQIWGSVKKNYSCSTFSLLGDVKWRARLFFLNGQIQNFNLPYSTTYLNSFIGAKKTSQRDESGWHWTLWWIQGPRWRQQLRDAQPRRIVSHNLNNSTYKYIFFLQYLISFCLYFFFMKKKAESHVVAIFLLLLVKVHSI
jgi:hypothetical protein